MELGALVVLPNKLFTGHRFFPELYMNLVWVLCGFQNCLTFREHCSVLWRSLEHPLYFKHGVVLGVQHFCPRGADNVAEATGFNRQLQCQGKRQMLWEH